MAADGGGDPVLARLDAQFAELADLLQSARSGPPDPERVVQFTARALSSGKHCALTFIRGRGAPVTIAATSDLARQVDEIQYAVGEGPCLEAIASSGVARCDELAGDRRWPEFARRAVAETGVRSMLGLRLYLDGEDRAAMNIYAERPSAFGEDDVAVAAIFAPFAALSLQSALRARDAENLQAALRSSRQIGTAIGILMAQQKITSEQAFAQLSDASQHLNRKLRDIAAVVELTGRLPEN